MKSKSILCLVLAVMLAAVWYAPCLAAENDEVLTVFTVSERVGMNTEKFLAKRGIPFADGVLSENDSVYVRCVETGEAIAPQTRVLQKYEDGYVNWLLVAIAVDLKANESKTFELRRGKRRDDAINVVQKDGTITVDTGAVTAEFDSNGIVSLIYGGKNVLNQKGEISSCVQYGTLYNTTAGKAEVIDKGNTFVRVKVSAPYGQSVMRTEKTYTLVKGSSRISVDNACVSYNSLGLYTDSIRRYDYIDSLYESYYLADGFSAKTGSGSRSETSKIVCTGYASAYNDAEDISFSMVSRDIEKFKGAVSPGVVNGFAVKDGAIIYAPILYGTRYTWQDGLSRTTHSEIILKHGENNDLETALKAHNSPPSVTVDVSAYVNAGVLAGDKVSALAKAQIGEIVWTKNKRGGRIDAGTIPFALDSEADFTGMNEIHLAEIDYNVWHAVMATGNADLYDVVRESTEAYADVMQYKGSVEQARGLGRYRFGIGTPNSEGSHPYYSEFSNLCMAYLMTGDEYFYNQCYEIADVMCSLARAAVKMSGHTMTSTTGWGNGQISINKAHRTEEIRAAFQIRSMYNAYRLFGEERFKDLAKEIGLWSAAVQEEDGSWPQVINQSGEPIANTHGLTGITSWVMYKNYIMLYTQRGHCEYFRQTHDMDIFPQIQKFANWLIGQMGDNDWMWDPCSDIEKCETGEDYSRGKSPFQEMMSAEIFATVFNETHDDRYLNALARVLSNYIASARKSGFVSQRYNAEGYIQGQISPIFSGQNTTLLHIDTMLGKIFTENREKIVKMGYEGVAAVFADGAEYIPEQVTSTYNTKEVGANLYRRGDKRYLFVSNNSGYLSGEWEKDISLKVSGNSSLWTEMECETDNLYEVNLKKHLDMYGYVYSRELPVKLSAFSGKINAYVTKYDSDAIEFDISGTGSAKITVTNGDFAVTPGESYSITVADGDKKHVTVKRGNGAFATENGLEFNIDLSGNIPPFWDVLDHWCKNDAARLYDLGIIKGTGEGMFSPEKTVTRREVIMFIMRSMGVSDDDALYNAQESGIIGSENPDEPATRADIIKYCMNALYNAKPDGIGGDTVKAYEYFLPRSYESDREAVKADMEKIVFDNMSLENNIILPGEGMYGSEITWTGGNEYLSPSGRVNRPDGGSEDKKAVLTAMVRRGNAVLTKDFEFTVLSNLHTKYRSGSFADGNIAIKRLKGDFHFKYSATPASKCDLVMGFHDDSATPGAYTQIPMILRFSPSGKIDAYSGNGYRAESDIDYEPGVTYTFEVSGSTASKKYSAVVTDSKGGKWTLADNYSFRTTAITASDTLDGISFVAALGEGFITGLEIAPASGGDGESGIKSAAEYFGAVRGDVKVEKVSGARYMSTEPGLLSDNGKYIASPSEDKTVYILQISDGVPIFNDISSVSGTLLKDAVPAAAIGLIRGDGNNMLCPGGLCTRAQAASIIRRFCDLKNN